MTSSTDRFDREAQRLTTLIPCGPRVAVLGSTDFYHPESERTCIEVGRLLAAIPKLILITGGVEGIGEAVGRSFFQERRRAGDEPLVFHILPDGEVAWDYGVTLFAGADMSERREVLARLAPLFLVMEGGPRTLHEMEIATTKNAMIIPVGRSGGEAASWYARMPRPHVIDESIWSALGAANTTPEETAVAIHRAILSCL